MELKGVEEELDEVRGRSIMRKWDEMMGDKRWGIDKGDKSFFEKGKVIVEEGKRIDVEGVDGFEEGWF